MKKIIILAFIFLLASFHTIAQLSFVRVDTVKVTDTVTPFTNAWAGGFNYPMFCEIDLNGDSIMDIVVFENGGPPGNKRIMPFLNYGTPGKVDYHYAPQYISHFPNVKGFMCTYDYNHDGKMDLFSLSDATNSGIMVYRNDFDSISGLHFTMIVDPILSKYAFGSYNIFASEVSVPAFLDVDNDGDMDIISWPPFPNGSLEYQRGLAVDSGWSFDSLRFKNVSQCWGSFAIQVGTAVNDISAFGISCRTADPDSSMHWDEGTAAKDDTQSIILVFDNNGDGAKDALIGGFADNNALLVMNGGTALHDSMASSDDSFPRYNVPINLPSFPFFFYLDVDNDGVKDLIVTSHSVSNFRGTLFYKNLGATDKPVFDLQPHMLLQEDMIEVGTRSAPQLFDYDADGLPDLLIGDESYHDTSGVDHKGITLYKNIGTPSAPRFQLVTRDYAGLDALNGLGGVCPTFGDLNGDGAIDMIVGLGDCPPGISSCPGNGQLLYYENTAGAGNPANFVLAGINYQNISVSSNSAPQLYDLNHDGLLDLIIGSKAGVIKYYENTGSATVPAFDSIPTIDTLGGILLYKMGGIVALSDTNLRSGYSAPFFYNDNGIDKLILGTEIGKLYVFDSITGNLSGNYHLADSLINGEEGERLIPYIGDINHDGHPDMLVGNYNGGLSLFMNTDTSLILGAGKTQPTVRSSFSVYPNPASDELHLNFYHTQNMNAAFEMLNDIGQVVYKATVTEPNMTIPLKGFANGIYLVRFSSDDNTQLQKVVVRK